MLTNNMKKIADTMKMHHNMLLIIDRTDFDGPKTLL
jgi:hypothetical protein